jgi:hypothetical protein
MTSILIYYYCQIGERGAPMYYDITAKATAAGITADKIKADLGFAVSIEGNTISAVSKSALTQAEKYIYTKSKSNGTLPMSWYQILDNRGTRWGIRGQELIEGTEVEVVRKDGTKSTVTVGKIIGIENGLQIAEIA